MSGRKPSGFNYELRAGVPRVVRVEGRYVHIKEASAGVSVRFDDDAPTPLAKGMGAEDADGYSRVVFVSDVDQTIEVIFSRGPVTDGRGSANITIDSVDLSAGTVSSLQRTEEVSASVAADLREKNLSAETIEELTRPQRAEQFRGLPSVAVGGAAVQLAPENPNRRALHVSVAASDAPVLLGASDVTASSGLVLSPGEAVTLETEGAVYAIALASDSRAYAAETRRA